MKPFLCAVESGGSFGVTLAPFVSWMVSVAKQPAIVFFTDDYLADEELGLCSFAAQGLWMRCLLLAHKCCPRGELRDGSGRPLSIKQIARLVGGQANEVAKLLRELLRTKAATRLPDGTIVNRRMVRERKLSETRKQNGSKGGSKTQANAQAKPQANAQANAGMVWFGKEEGCGGKPTSLTDILPKIPLTELAKRDLAQRKAEKDSNGQPT